jgi:hypothetical protein
VRLIIAGSRDVHNQLWVDQAVAWALNDWGLLECVGFAPVRYVQQVVTEVVSGGARGVDELGERWAAAHGVHCHRMRADWVRHGRGAGLVRNRAMATYAALGPNIGLGSGGLVAVWDGVSSGTKHMIEHAVASGLRVYVRRVPT